jgi:hypothetical protein
VDVEREMAQRRQRRADENEEEEATGMDDEVEGEQHGDNAATHSVRSQENAEEGAAAEEDDAAVGLGRTTPGGLQSVNATVERSEAQADGRWAWHAGVMGGAAGEAVVQEPEPVLAVAVDVVMTTDASTTGQTDAPPPSLLATTIASDLASNLTRSKIENLSAIEVITTVAPTAASTRALNKQETSKVAARAKVEALLASVNALRRERDGRNRTEARGEVDVLQGEAGNKRTDDSDWLDALQQMVVGKLQENLREKREEAAAAAAATAEADAETEEEAFAAAELAKDGVDSAWVDEEEDGRVVGDEVQKIRRSDTVLDGLNMLTMDQAKLLAEAPDEEELVDDQDVVGASPYTLGGTAKDAHGGGRTQRGSSHGGRRAATRKLPSTSPPPSSSPPRPPTAFQRLVCGWAASGRWDGVMSSVARDPQRQVELRESVPLGVEQLLITLQRKGVLQRWTRENCATPPSV